MGRALAAFDRRRLALVGAVVVAAGVGTLAVVEVLDGPERRPRPAAVGETPSPPAAASASPIAEAPSPTPEPSPTAMPSPGVGVGVPIPDVVGLSALQAIQVLQSFGLSVTSAEPTPGSPGVVVATDPAAAAMVVPGTPVTLFVGTTPERVDPGD